MNFKQIRDIIDKHGPMLLGLDLYPDLLDSKIHSHRGVPKGEKQKGMGHAMVVVGVRKEDPSEELKKQVLAESDLNRLSTILLIQNFWQSKEFIEMDLMYFAEATPALHSIQGTPDPAPTRYEETKQLAGSIRRAI
ncbi:MAG: hypothetical protein SGARI_001880 [Bacillariaceae sp.]